MQQSSDVIGQEISARLLKSGNSGTRKTVFSKHSSPAQRYLRVSQRRDPFRGLPRVGHKWHRLLRNLPTGSEQSVPHKVVLK